MVDTDGLLAGGVEAEALAGRDGSPRVEEEEGAGVI